MIEDTEPEEEPELEVEVDLELDDDGYEVGEPGRRDALYKAIAATLTDYPDEALTGFIVLGIWDRPHQARYLSRTTGDANGRPLPFHEYVGAVAVLGDLNYWSRPA